MSATEATILPPNAIAFIVDTEGETQLVVPKDIKEFHPTQLAASMLAIKLMKEPEWCHELAEEFKSHGN
jgi:hypothetical protein